LQTKAALMTLVSDQVYAVISPQAIKPPMIVFSS